MTVSISDEIISQLLFKVVRGLNFVSRTDGCWSTNVEIPDGNIFIELNPKFDFINVHRRSKLNSLIWSAMFSTSGRFSLTGTSSEEEAKTVLGMALLNIGIRENVQHQEGVSQFIEKMETK